MKEVSVNLDEFKLKVEQQVKVRNLLIDLPIKYKCQAINAIFSIDSEEARKVIKCSKLQPIKFSYRRSLLCITMLDFYDTPVGPFKELTFSMIIIYNSKFNFPFVSIPINLVTKSFGFIPLSVAQSTDIAIEHGNIITGYPHYTRLINLEFKKAGSFINVESYCGANKIIEFQIQKPKNEQIRHESHNTYSLRDNKITKFILETYGIMGKTKGGNLKLGNQELAGFLKKLKISNKPIYTIYYRDTLKIISCPIVIDYL